MKHNNRLPLQRLIGKIDNDFNIDHSDWIPRVAAWVTDALSQMKILPRECKTRKVEINDRIGIFPCDLEASSFQIYDTNGCEIDPANDGNGCGCGCGGGSIDTSFENNGSSPVEEILIDVDRPADLGGIYGGEVARIVSNGKSSKNFVFIPPNKFELNFDTDYITVKSLEVATYYDEYFDCDVPWIYDDGLLLEALAWYCLFKILSRGYKHQVYDIKSPHAHLNPFLQWERLRPKAQASVKIAISKNCKSGAWSNFFYNSTFLPRG